MKKINIEKIIRVITVAPVMAAVALSILFILRPGMFNGIADFVMALVFLTVLPLLAYPVQPLIPYFKDKGREGQRLLAIIMAVAGYIGGIIYALARPVSKELLIVYLVYLFSGILIFILNKVIKIKASGHACGVAGPVSYLVYFLGWYALAGIAVLALVYWASVRMKRHTLKQLIAGSIIPIVALVISILIV